MARDADDVDEGGWWKSSGGGARVLIPRSKTLEVDGVTTERAPSFRCRRAHPRDREQREESAQKPLKATPQEHTDAREEIIKPRQKIDHAHTNTHTHGTLLSRKIIFGWKLYTHLAVFSFVFAALGLPGLLCGFRRQGWTAQLVTVVLQVVERLRHLCLSGLQIS